MRDYKIVVLGAGGVGKSSLTVQFVQGVYIDTYDPTIEDSYRKQIEVDSRACDLEILDTAGVAQFTAMRELYIKSGRGFLLVYSVTDKNSLEELLSLREQVLRIKDSENVPMVLIGNKCDLVDERVLQPEDGIKISEKWGRVPFYETSAMHKTNVDEAFVDVVRQIMRQESMENKKLQDQAAAQNNTNNHNSNSHNNSHSNNSNSVSHNSITGGTGGSNINTNNMAHGAPGQSTSQYKKNQPLRQNQKQSSSAPVKKKKKKSSCVVF